jgi:hypothetical protein
MSRESRFSHLQDIEACTAGICFFGTPHHGTEIEKWGTILSIIAKSANSAPVRLPEQDSGMFRDRDVQDDFHNLLEKRKYEGANINITCFYETLPLSGYRGLVVPRDIAVMISGVGYPISANHIVGKMGGRLYIMLMRVRT